MPGFVIFQFFFASFCIGQISHYTSNIIRVKESCHVKLYVTFDCCTNETFVKIPFTTTAKYLGACKV